jgi:predicted RecB family nuclease
MERLIDDGMIESHQRDVISDRGDVAEVTAEDPDEAFRQTLAFMAEGRQVIFHGVLVDRHWVGHPDILEKVEGVSRLGNHYYVAADIKRSRYLRDEFKFQGCFYAELLSKIQEVKPVNGYVITPDKTVLSYPIEEMEAQFHLNLMEIEKIIAGKKPAHFVTTGCKQSPWFSECRGESEMCDDLSLLNRVWREEVAALHTSNINTISGLAKLTCAELERRVPNMSVARLEIMHDYAWQTLHSKTHPSSKSTD